METLERLNPRDNSDHIGVIDKIPFNFPESQETFRQYVELFEKSLANIDPREAQPGETANATVTYTYGERLDLNTPEVRQEAVSSCATNLAEVARSCSWWSGIDAEIGHVKEGDLVPNETAIFARHTFMPVVDGVPASSAYSVYEMGEPSSPADIESVANALGIIDQYSGGALTGSRIVLANGMQWRNNRNAGEILGLNTEKATYLNIKAIHQIAEETGADPAQLTATVLVHEVLERWRYGSTGKLFPEHFEYTDDYTTGDIFDSIHMSIRAKNEQYKDSRPVREYGAATSSEDLATSIDALVAHAEGWDTSKAARFASKPDKYRSEIAMQLMTEAAEIVGRGTGNPGFVGAELRYDRDKQGNVTGSRPARTLEHTVIDAQTAFEQEIEYIASKLTPYEVVVKQEELWV